MLAFETIGSATAIIYDGTPLLSTDAWVNDSAYFGSWTHDYEIPSAQLDAIRRCRFHWFSHGHPDHLNVESLPALSGGEFLVADHYGGRIYRDLVALGYRVRVLKDREWVRLSPRVRILNMACSNQDSCLLVDVGGHLIIDLNDAPDLGWSYFIRRVAKSYKHSYVLQLHDRGGADMANIYLPGGARAKPLSDYKTTIAPRVQGTALRFGAKAAIPFSSFHRYQRSDSVWANELVPELADYATGADPTKPPILPAFVRIDCVTGEVTPLCPPRKALTGKAPEEYGDNWSDYLDAGEFAEVKNYFQRIERLRHCFGFLTFRVGGREHTLDLNPDKGGIGITFEVPRNSLLTAVRYRVFDDLLIGNFMKTTLFGVKSLYPDFSPFVAKYSDNGGAHSLSDLKEYHRHYRRRDLAGYYLHWLEASADRIVRGLLPDGSAPFRVAKSLYWGMMRFLALLVLGEGCGDLALGVLEALAPFLQDQLDALQLREAVLGPDREIELLVA
jgi:L-ascorbate metabolism protein UlaG (beta-lactamase superfamily)